MHLRLGSPSADGYAKWSLGWGIGQAGGLLAFLRGFPERVATEALREWLLVLAIVAVLAPVIVSVIALATVIMIVIVMLL